MTATGNWVAGPMADRARPRSIHHGLAATNGQVVCPVREASWLDLFFNVPPEIEAKLESAARRRAYKRGETVLRKGDPADSLCLIVRGQVKLLLSADGRDELLISVLGEGEYFGEVSLLDGGAWPVSAIAMEPTEVYVLDRKTVLEAVAACPELAEELLGTLTDRLRNTYEFIQDAIFLDVAGRLAKKILDLARDYGRDTPEGCIIDMDLTQQDLARMVGVTRESVNKHLGSFRARGMIETQDRRIVVLRPEDLQRRVY